MESPPYPDADRDVPAKNATSTSGAHLPFLREEIEGSIPERFERVAERFPGQLAIKTQGQALTYVDLEKASNRLARAVVSQRGEDEEPVILLLGHDVRQDSMKRKAGLDDELRPEYELSELLRGGVRGKYREGTNLVLLAPDVEEVFPDENAVNEALRLVKRLARIPKAGQHSTVES